MNKNGLSPFLLSFGLVLLIFTGIIISGFWCYLGQLEESVPGMGQVIPEGYIRKVMSPVNGEIKKIYVQENQKIKAGQPLFELDPQLAKIEQNGVLEQLAILSQETKALNQALNKNSGTNYHNSSMQSAWVDATRQEFQSRIDLADMQISKTAFQYKEATEKYNQTAKILSTSEKLFKQYEELYKEGGLAEKDLREYEQKVLEQRGRLATIEQELKARKIEYNQAKKQPESIEGGYKKEILGKMTDYQKDIVQLRTQAEKTYFAGKHLIIKAPMDGIINEQAIHGIGETVATGQTLLSLVPFNTKLVIEAKVLNKDMAFIYPEQKVSLRLDAMPYQHFGKLSGKVISISPSTMQSKDGNPYYLVRIKPDKTILREFTGKQYSILPGMTVAADFITRKKSIYKFFIDPIQYQLDRAFRDPTTR
jgi:hemolysin D